MEIEWNGENKYGHTFIKMVTIGCQGRFDTIVLPHIHIHIIHSMDFILFYFHAAPFLYIEIYRKRPIFQTYIV